VEHEYDVLLVGTHVGDPIPDPTEVAAWEWADLAALQRDMNDRPERYAPWFHIGLPKVI
jgi:isopentenyl-diphosphate delta-isomerase